jgi:hypothetical protein
MKDLSRSDFMWLKAWLVLLTGITSAALRVLKHPQSKTVLYMVAVTACAFPPSLRLRILRHPALH